MPNGAGMTGWRLSSRAPHLGAKQSLVKIHVRAVEPEIASSPDYRLLAMTDEIYFFPIFILIIFGLASGALGTEIFSVPLTASAEALSPITCDGKGTLR